MSEDESSEEDSEIEDEDEGEEAAVADEGSSGPVLKDDPASASRDATEEAGAIEHGEDDAEGNQEGGESQASEGSASDDEVRRIAILKLASSIHSRWWCTDGRDEPRRSMIMVMCKFGFNAR